MGDVAVVAGGDILQEKMEKEINHVLVVPFPLQGHINPLVQFSKRLVSKGLKVTLAVTKYTAKSMQDRPPTTSSSISVEPISDGIQEGEIIPDEETYLDRIKVNVSKTLTDLIIRLNQSSCPPKFLIYDSIMPWALDVGQKLGLRGASFFTQAYSVNAIYYHFRRGEIKVPANSENVTVPPLPTLSVNDLPSFICDPNSDPALVDLLLSQFSNFQEADWVLNNSFDQLESEVVNWMSSQWRIKNIGPTVPSMFLDKRLEDDKDYGLSLFKPDADTCLTWLDSKQPGSVVYVSFGSLASLEGEQMIELARGLQMSGSHFLWVVRDLEWKLPASFIEETSDKGLVVSWSPQLEVLAHKSVGCFMTHCGWNSTLEALSLGVPMVAMPQWTDQPTNAKFVADVWKVGIRVKVNEGGMVSREEISECIKEIMEGEKGTEIRKNSEKWRDLARNAVDEGGSSASIILFKARFGTICRERGDSRRFRFLAIRGENLGFEIWVLIFIYRVLIFLVLVLVWFGLVWFLIMGLGSNNHNDDDALVDDADGGGGGGGDCGNGGKSFGSVSCSICLETVTDNGDRSWAKLQCGHQFHLDCIGSAFNVKGAMQCPNCRKIEKGQWLYANGYRSFPEFSMDDWTHDEDLYDLGSSEMSFGFHWCPFSLTRLPSSFEDGEFSSSTYHDHLVQHAIFAEHTAVSSATHPCPYIAYFGPVHPSSSNSSGSISDSSNFNNHWTSPSMPGEMATSYGFPAAMDLHYHTWDHHSPFSSSSSRMGNTEQLTGPPVPQRSARTSSDVPRSGSFVHPFLFGHSSSARAGSSAASSMIPPYPGSNANARARDRVQALQAYYQQQQPSNSPAVRSPMISGTRRSNRGIAQVGPVASSSDHAGAFYFVPSSTSSRNFQEAENPLHTRFHGWEREHLPSFSINQVDRDSGWSTFPGGGSDPGMRSSSFRQRHGSERMSSQSRS